MFKYLILLASMVIAGVAAFFSISGLGSLFAGAFIPVVIMASSLEAGKLVTASFLTRRWKDITLLLRMYYIVATSVLILITSAGIYGFLTAAYQTTADQLSIVTQQANVLELRKERYQEQLDLYSGERERISQTILQLTEGLTNNQIQYVDQETGQLVTSTSSATRNAIQQQLNIATTERDEISSRIEEATDSITSLDIQRIDLEANNEVAAEIGPLRYMSNLTGWSMDKVVNIFALLIVFVFDPLAVALVIGFNHISVKDSLGKRRSEKYKIYNDKKEPVRVGWEEAAKEGAERYKNALAQLAKSDIDTNDLDHWMDDHPETIEVSDPIPDVEIQPESVNINPKVDISSEHVKLNLDNSRNTVLSLLDELVHNPRTHKKIKAEEALALDDDHPAKIAAVDLLNERLFKNK
ncbi:MAG: hypothetical protein VW683_00285 [Betaproteobacteria bacterium]|jgi:hypothetical protein